MCAVADQIPSAEVVGIDLSPIQPDWVPPNCQFTIDDVECDWVNRGTNALDLVHMRNVTPFLRDVPLVLRHAFKSVVAASRGGAHRHC